MKKTNLSWRYGIIAGYSAITATLVAAGMCLSVSAQSVISFNISSPKYNNLMTAGDYAGAPGAHTNNWNNMLAASDGSSANLTLGDGSVDDSAGNVVSGMAVTLHPSGGGIYNRGAGTFTNDSKMYIDVADTYGGSGYSSFGYFDITNIPYSNYSVYCYFRPDNGSGSANTRGGFWLITNTPSGSQRYYIQNQSNDVAQTQEPVPSTSGSGPSSVGVNYVESFTTAIPSGGTTWSSIQGGNYAVFTGLTNSYTRIWFGGLGNGSGSGGSHGMDDLGNYVNGGSPAVRFKVCGFQIVETTPGAVTNIYLSSTSLTLHAGDPSGTQVTVLGDENNGIAGAHVTSSSTFTSDNPTVFTVNSAGLLQAGTNGTANLIVTYTNSLNTVLSVTNPVTVIGPLSLSISVAKTSLLAGNGQGDKTTASLYASFSDAPNVLVNNFHFVSFSTSTPGVITVNSNGTITAVGSGTFSVTGTYDGLSATASDAGIVTSYTAPPGSPALSVKLTDSGHAMTFHDLSGAPGVRDAYWNNIVMNTGNVTNALNSVVDNQGNSLAGTAVQVIPDVLDDSVFNTIGTPTTNESTLFDTYYDSGMNNGTTVFNTLVVSNVPYSSYDVYFYFYNDNTSNGTNRPGEVTIDGATQYRINNMSSPSQPDNDGNGYVLAAPQPSGLPASVADVPWGNVIKFSGITDPTLTTTWAGVGQDYIGDAAQVTRVRLVGFQIVKSLVGLTATNLYLSSGVVPAQLPGNPAAYGLTVLADFSDGTRGGNITTLPGITFASSNTNIFGVSTNGVITPGLTAGTATLTISYQTNTLQKTVTNLAPTSVTVKGVPDTVYLDSVIGVQPAHAAVYASFPGYANVNITGFGSIGFVDQGSAAATLNIDGSITANAYGQANLGVSYLGATYVSADAFTVASINDAAVLKHLYTFHDSPGSSTILDSVGGANGTVYPALGTNLPITLDGAHAIFPGDAGYTNEPYIALPSGIISTMGDVTIELWCGQNRPVTWSRFLGFGNTPKGSNPRVYGGTATSGLQFIDRYPSPGVPDFYGPAGDLFSPYAFTNGAEYQVVMVCAPNAGVSALYVNGVLATNGTAVTSYLSSSVNDTADWLGVSLSNADPPLAGWINNLAIYEGVRSAAQIYNDYTNGVGIYQPPSSPVATNSVPIGVSVAAGQLNLAWPPDHLGWTLETNSVGLAASNAWYPYPGSTTITNVSIPIGTNANVFYRLKHQE